MKEKREKVRSERDLMLEDKWIWTNKLKRGVEGSNNYCIYVGTFSFNLQHFVLGFDFDT